MSYAAASFSNNLVNTMKPLKIYYRDYEQTKPGKKPLNINCPLIYSIRQKVYHSPLHFGATSLSKNRTKGKKKHFSTTMHHYNKQLTRIVYYNFLHRTIMNYSSSVLFFFFFFFLTGSPLSSLLAGSASTSSVSSSAFLFSPLSFFFFFFLLLPGSS